VLCRNPYGLLVGSLGSIRSASGGDRHGGAWNTTPRQSVIRVVGSSPRCGRIALVALVLAGGCASNPVQGPGPPVRTSTQTPRSWKPVRQTDTPRPIMRLCERSVGDGICPQELPRTMSAYRARVIHLGTAYRVLDVAASGPYRGMTPKNSPPRFAHVVLKAGDLEHGFPFTVPSGSPVPMSQHPGPRRQRSLLLGTPTWGGRTGTLLLAPPYPLGGIDGDHLVFTWTEAGTDFSVSLHAWPPLSEAEGTLRLIVESIA
jgi:hypothetical protein